MNAVYWITPGRLAGRPGPQEAPWNLQELWDGGFRTIVSLVYVDGEAIRAADFTHYKAPLNGGFAFLPLLRKRLVRQVIPVVDFLAGEVQAQRPTLVHCRQGKDRTGLVLAAYLIRHGGLSAEEAVERLREANPIALTSFGFSSLPALLAALSR